ncbi:16S rRNA (uracil(1498)-N(3))-methyltransferase [Serpentinimonas barnesii]|uniref:16S rRNA (uracil(1498)-N(3))-methyltransferase n=1 Tax=Serpentinimonas barnesii TaxID=1458427 RepID=UPI000495A175|nr:16S rRNA (uracil(1498)-N(3))-methyltransferase [Serpentinimonas barnesii]
MPRIHHPEPLHVGQTLDLGAAAVRHVQVLRLQPGDTLTLFGGFEHGGECVAEVLQMGRNQVQVQVQALREGGREPQRPVHLAVGMPANERMDWLVEKATELGVASIQPLHTERSVLRLQAERAVKKVAHWQAVAVSACEQCGGNRVPLVHPVQSLQAWLQALGAAPGLDAPWRAVLSLAPGSQPWPAALAQVQPPTRPLCLVLGPEGGLAAAEEQALRAQGFAPVSLGPRVLRSETAALAALALALG